MESYALKLCVHNQNETMLKFLINGDPQAFQGKVATASN